MDNLQHKVDRFLIDLDASPFTVRAYRTALQRFMEYRLCIDNDVLCVFHARMRADDYKASTRRAYLTALRVFLAWLEAHDQLPPGYSAVKAQARLRASQSHRRRPYIAKIPDRNLELLLSYYRPSADQSACERLETLRDNAIVQVFFSTACRIRELASLTRGHVNDGHAGETVILGKGSRQRTIYLTPEALAAIRAYLKERNDSLPALFLSHRRGKGRALTVSSIYRVVKQAATALHLNPNTSPHMIRHFVATDMLRNGVEPVVVQTVLGHTHLDTTLTIYAHIGDDEVKDGVMRYQRKRRKRKAK